MLFFLIVIMKHMGSILCIDTPMYYANQNSFLSPLWYYGNMSKPIMTSLPWSCCVHFFYNGIFMIYIYIYQNIHGVLICGILLIVLAISRYLAPLFLSSPIFQTGSTVENPFFADSHLLMVNKPIHCTSRYSIYSIYR